MIGIWYRIWDEWAKEFLKCPQCQEQQQQQAKPTPKCAYLGCNNDADLCRISRIFSHHDNNSKWHCIVNVCELHFDDLMGSKDNDDD